jgi:hypothetical protein
VGNCVLNLLSVLVIYGVVFMLTCMHASAEYHIIIHTGRSIHQYFVHSLECYGVDKVKCKNFLAKSHIFLFVLV